MSWLTLKYTENKQFNGGKLDTELTLETQCPLNDALALSSVCLLHCDRSRKFFESPLGAFLSNFS